MIDTNDKIRDVELKVGLLEKDVSLTNTICSRLADSIDKIQDMNQNVVSLISLHGQRHEQHEKVEEEVKEDIRELYSRIANVSREIHERIDQTEHHITSRIDALRTDLLNHKKDDKKNEVSEEDKKLSEKIADIEKWRWMVVGAIALASWFIGHADFFGKVLK